MKYSFAFFILLFFCSCHSANQQKGSLNLVSDSGFILKKDGLNFLERQSLTDSSDNFWHALKGTDTIGRYYKLLDNSGYMVCLMTFDTLSKHLYNYLFEIRTIGSLNKVISKERFVHNDYPCCWGNFYEGFRKINNYFYLKTCETCPSCCSGSFYLFKKLRPQNSMNCIRESYSADFFGKTELLSSDLIFEDSILRVEYLVKILDKHNLSRRFYIDYIYRNDHWFISDSTKISYLDFSKY